MEKIWINLVSLLTVFSVLSTGVALGHVVRSDDPSPLEPVVQRLVQDVDSLRAQLATQEAEFQRRISDLEAANNRRVSFSAWLVSGPDIQPSAGHVIPFHNVVTNTGNAYNNLTGLFTAPFDGDYFFIVSIDVSSTYNCFGVRKNGHTVFVGDHDDTTSTHETASGIVSLVTGDIISVHHCGSEGALDSGLESTFTGFLIR